MARGDLKTKPEWQHQAELRAKNKKSSKITAPIKKEAPVHGFRTLYLQILDRSQDNLQECYRRLKSDTVIAYFRKFKYHSARQNAVMKGRVAFPDLPGGLYTRILSEMTTGGVGWKQGSRPEQESSDV